MGINNLAVQTFSSSGSQSVSRANKADETKQITSDFISRPPMKYINGSGISVIPGTLTKLPYGSSSSPDSFETFSIPNNIDAISDMVLSMDLNISPGNTTYACGGIYYSKTFLLDIINSIEIKMGGLTIQTIYAGDIYMRNYSELGMVVSHENSFIKKIDASYVETESIIGHTTASAETISFSVSIPFIGRSSEKDRSFLQTGSFTKNLTIVVKYNGVKSGVSNTLDIIPLLRCDGSGNNSTAVVDIATKLCILGHVITDTEKNFIKQNIVNRIVNTSTGIVTRKIQERFISSATGTTAINIDLDSIDLNVTHILFCLNVNIFNQDPPGDTSAFAYPSQFMTTTGGSSDVISPNTLHSNSQYVTGDTKLSSSWGKAFLDSNISVADVINPDVLGVFKGWLSSAELIIGNETTGQIPCSALYSNKIEFKLQNVDENFYVIKLADNSFSSAGIPFSRIKNKKLILNVNNKFFNTTANASIAKPTAANTADYITTIGAYAEDKKRDATISVCACGTTLQIINNNTISFSYI